MVQTRRLCRVVACEPCWRISWNPFSGIQWPSNSGGARTCERSSLDLRDELVSGGRDHCCYAVGGMSTHLASTSKFPWPKTPDALSFCFLPLFGSGLPIVAVVVHHQYLPATSDRVSRSTLTSPVSPSEAFDFLCTIAICSTSHRFAVF